MKAQVIGGKGAISAQSAFKSVALNQSPTARAGKSAPLPGVRLILVSELVMPLAKREIALFDSLRPI